MRAKFGKRRSKKSFWILIIALFVFTIYSYYLLDKNIRPTIMAMSEIKGRLIANEAINDAVSKKLSENAFKDIIKVKTDNIGRVTMVQANTVEMNRLAVETSLAIQNSIKDIGAKGLNIPFGNILGSHLFANFGPNVNILIQPAGSVNVDFTTEFEEAGINQTRLKIYLIVKTEVQIVVPLASNKIDVSTHIPVSETIIVGDVPQSYINVPKENNDFLNVTPIKDPFKN